ncbi:MAG: hypothetical protein Tsb0013_12760 [Phycisphaerales bacterium]
MTPLGIIGTLLLVLAAIVAVILLPFVLYKLFKGLGWFISHIFTFVGGMIGDTLRLIGGVITSIVFFPLVVMNIAIGRWSASKHFWRSFQDEVVGVGHCLYRLAIGHPARLLLLTPLTEGIERRIPEAIAQAPTRDTPTKRTGAFDGYTIVGSLKGGGSGGKLYVAQPDRMKRAAFARRGREDVERVVIKSFSVQDGSTLPQIVRESRALEAARDLGLVLDHELTSERFFYAMPYVPGDPLTVVTERLHTKSGADGLRGPHLGAGLGYIADLLSTLDRYHDAGLWHKDIKPDNIIVGPDGRAHLVDLGLVTPLRSAMTLTTHGTEYFRDPELVRLALRGVKVHEVPGVKFDIYGAGACLYALVERSFPAHGGLSQISRRCPEALRWIVRRAMADLNQRYGSAREMLADLEYVRQAPDPFAVKPAELPSMSGGMVDDLPEAPEPVAFTPPVGSPTPPPAAPRERARPRRKRRISVTDWWTGRYSVEGDEAGPVQRPEPRVVPVHQRRPAADQLRHARERASAARARAHTRMTGRGRRGYRGESKRGNNAFLSGVLVIVFFVIALGVIGALMPGVRKGSSGVAVATHTQPVRSSILVSDNQRTRTVEFSEASLGTYIGDTVDEAFVVLDPHDVLRTVGSPSHALFVALGSAGADLDDEPDAETEAALLALVGAALPGNPEATLDLLSWLENADAALGYAGVLWIGSPEFGDADAPTWQLVLRGEAPEPEPTDDEEAQAVGSDTGDRVWFDGRWLDEGWWDSIGERHEEAVRRLEDRIERDLDEAEDRIERAVDDAQTSVLDGIDRVRAIVTR